MKIFRFRLYPSKSQKTLIDKHLKIGCEFYNRCLEHKIKIYKETGQVLSGYDLSRLATQWKKEENSPLKELYSPTIQKLTQRLDYTFKNFFRRLKIEGKAGFPRFKSENRFRSIPYRNQGFKFKDNIVELTKIGPIKGIFHQKIKGKIKDVILVKISSNKYYISVTTDFVPKKRKNLTKIKSIGLDLGLKNLATLSTGTTIENPKFYHKLQDKLKKVQRRYSKSKTRKNRHSLALVREKIANCRKDYLMKLSIKIIKKYNIICLEKLTQETMLSFKEINKTIYDTGWHTFVEMLVYKAENAGKQVIFVNPANTSKTCSECGYINKDFTIKESVYKCRCGLKINRDKNAAINIKRLGLQSLTV